MGFNHLTDVVKNFLIINVIIFFGTYTLMPDSRVILGLLSPESGGFRPYQLVSSIFMHSDFNHILFNMIGLFVFGPMVEYKLGPKKFFSFYIMAGLSASALQMGAFLLGDSTQYVLWGASGCVMGVAVAYAMLFPKNDISLIFPPITLPAWQLVLIYISFDIFFAFRGSGGGVAHFAHIGGAIFGYLFIRFFGKDDFRIN